MISPCVSWISSGIPASPSKACLRESTLTGKADSTRISITASRMGGNLYWPAPLEALLEVFLVMAAFLNTQIYDDTGEELRLLPQFRYPCLDCIPKQMPHAFFLPPAFLPRRICSDVCNPSNSPIS